MESGTSFLVVSGLMALVAISLKRIAKGFKWFQSTEPENGHDGAPSGVE
jgi:hypothetical protein